MGENIGFTIIAFFLICHSAGNASKSSSLAPPIPAFFQLKGRSLPQPPLYSALRMWLHLMEKQVYGKKQFRFNAKKGAYVALIPSSEVWQIENISLKELSFWYVPSGEPTEDPTQIDIFVTDAAFYLKCVPCKIVSDSPVKIDTSNDLPWRRQTVEFGKMKPAQQAVLKSFLGMNTTKKT